MGLFSGWFRKSEPEDYEQVLAKLSIDIQKRQTHLSEIRLRERRSTLLFSVYALALWIAYVSIWYTGFLPTMSRYARGSNVEILVEGLPVFVGPIVILFIRRIVQIWYTRIGDTEEKHLVTLRKQQRDKIEEIKKKTNYYSTRTLIERYDDGTPARSVADSPPPQRPTATEPKPNGVRPPQQPQQRQQLVPQPQQVPMGIPRTPVKNNRLQPPMTPGLKQQLSPSPQRPLPPPRKQWYDRLADAILGDEDATAGAVTSRYALICQKCFTHNGLVKESSWETTQYICRACGQFNPSPKAASEGFDTRSSSVSPSRPTVGGGPGTLAPPIELPFGTENGPNVEVRGGKSVRQRKSSRKSNGKRQEKEKEDGSPLGMDLDSESDS